MIQEFPLLPEASGEAQDIFFRALDARGAHLPLFRLFSRRNPPLPGEAMSHYCQRCDAFLAPHLEPDMPAYDFEALWAQAERTAQHQDRPHP